MSTEMLLTAGVSAIVGVMLTLIAVLARAYLRGDRADAQEDEHEDEADNLRRSIEGLQKRLATHASFEQASRSLKTQYGELAHKYNELVRLHNDLVRRFNEQIQSSKLQAATHKKQSAELEKTNASLTSSLRDISDRLADLGRQKDHLEERCRQAEEELSSRPQVQEPVPATPVVLHDPAIEADLRGQIESLQSEITGLRKQLADGGTKADRLQQEIAALEGKNRELGGSISGLNTTLDEHRRLLLESEGGRRELELEVIEWQDKYRESTRSSKETGERNAALEKQFQQLQKSFGEQAQSLRDLGAQLQAAVEGLSVPGESVSLAAAEGPPTWLGAKQAIVGLDFGTYSTKIVVRARGDKDSHVVVIDEPTEGYPSSVSPSLVRLTDGKLYFGSQAAKGPREGLFRSLKVEVVPIRWTVFIPSEATPNRTPHVTSYSLGRAAGPDFSAWGHWRSGVSRSEATTNAAEPVPPGRTRNPRSRPPHPAAALPRVLFSAVEGESWYTDHGVR